MLTLCFLSLLVAWLTRDKIVAGLLACERMPMLAGIATILLSYGVTGQRVAPSHECEFKGVWGRLAAMFNFATSGVMPTLILAQTIGFMFMCHSHPGEVDNLLQVVLFLVIALQYGLLWIAFESAERALEGNLVQRLVTRLARAPRIIVPSRVIGVPTPPPLPLLYVA